MIGAATYILTAALLAAVAIPVGFSAVRLRRRLLPEWEGAPAHLIDALLAVALLIWLSELLGVLQILYAWTLVVCSLGLAAAVALFAGSPRISRESPPAGGAGGGGVEDALARNPPLHR